MKLNENIHQLQSQNKDLARKMAEMEARDLAMSNLRKEHAELYMQKSVLLQKVDMLTAENKGLELKLREMEDGCRSRSESNIRSKIDELQSELEGSKVEEVSFKRPSTEIDGSHPLLGP